MRVAVVAVAALLAVVLVAAVSLGCREVRRTAQIQMMPAVVEVQAFATHVLVHLWHLAPWPVHPGREFILARSTVDVTCHVSPLRMRDQLDHTDLG